MNFHPFGACDGSLESSNPTLFNHMGTSHFNTSYSIRSCSFLSKMFLLILTGSIASKGIEVLLDPRNLLLPTIGLHHMEGRFLHLLTLLKIKFPLDHHLDPQKVTHRNRRPLQSSSGPAMKRIHLDPSLCLHLTPVI